jgi:hypothetical protein
LSTFDVNSQAAGLINPRYNAQIAKAADYVVVTSGSFATQWEMYIPIAAANAFKCQVNIGCAVGTTGEAQLTSTGLSITSAAIAITSGMSAYIEWNWAPSALSDATAANAGPYTFKLQVRRLTGSGDINVYPPVQAFNAPAELIAATATGV